MSRKFVLVSILTLLAALAVAAEPAPSITVTLAISGMHCEGCASGIAAMLKRTDGVVKAEVSYENRQAIVQYDAAKTTTAKIIEAVEKIGYKASIKK